MITTTCRVCGGPVVISRHPERATCSAACAKKSGTLHHLHVSHTEWLILRNFVASAEPGVQRMLRLDCGLVIVEVEVEPADSIAEHKAVAP